MKADLRCLTLVVVVVASVWAPTAEGQPAPHDAATPNDGVAEPSVRLEPSPTPSDVGAVARALFQQGRDLLQVGDHDGAAAKFEESFRLDPGGGTKLNQALAYELGGRTASAWAAFNEALRIAKLDGRADRIKEAEAHLQRLQPMLSWLRIVVPDPALVPGLEVRRDGLALGKASWNAEIPVDPGQHRIDASAPGKQRWSTSVRLGGGDRREVAITIADDAREPARPTTSAGRSPTRTLAWISLLAGGAALVGAGVTGGLALAKKHDLDARSTCMSAACATSDSSAIDSYNSMRQLSAVGFWAGGALATVGLVLFLVSSEHRARGAADSWVTPTANGLAARF